MTIELEYVNKTFESIKDLIPTLCQNWGKNGRYGQNLYGDVLDWVRDQYNEIYHSIYCDTFVRLIIGEYVIKEALL